MGKIDYTSGHWLVTMPDFLKINNYTSSNLMEAMEWCQDNCAGNWRGSGIYPWAFELEMDANKFIARWGGTLVKV